MSNAEIIARTLGSASDIGSGRWKTLCPAHNDKNPSLVLQDTNGILTVKCWAGCTRPEVLNALEQLGLINDKWLLRGGYATQYAPCFSLDKEKADEHRKFANLIWEDTRSANGTPAENYLRKRGYTRRRLPKIIRYHPGLKHRPSGLIFPTMVAAVFNELNCEFLGIHRTFLMPDGSDKAPVKDPKMSLGNISGGAVHLFDHPNRRKLIIAEGIETAISVFEATGMPTWAALSAGGIEKLVLPPLPYANPIIICADNDASGRGLRAAEKAALRWHAQGRKVRIAMPHEVQSDFNDLLRR